MPVRNEAESILPLLAEIQFALAGLGSSEVVYLDNGSSDATALLTGVRAAQGEWIATLDGDGQNDPANIAKLGAARDAARVDSKL